MKQIAAWTADIAAQNPNLVLQCNRGNIWRMANVPSQSKCFEFFVPDFFSINLHKIMMSIETPMMLR